MESASQVRHDIERKLKQHLEQLPVLPTVVVQLMGLNAEADDYFDRVRKIVETEPNFSTRLLVAANSAAHASRVEVTTVAAALTRIGSRNASNLLLALAVARVFIPRDAWEKSLWRHALQVATMARALAWHCTSPDITPDEAYSCGLLHDVGRFVMFQQAPEQLRKIDEADWHSAEALVAMEKSICGLTHCELGAMACEQWRLPDVIARVVRNHHAPVREAARSRAEQLTALVRVADVAMFSSAIPGSPSLIEAEQSTLEQAVCARMPSFLKVSQAELRTLIQQCTEEAQAACVGLGVG